MKNITLFASFLCIIGCTDREVTNLYKSKNVNLIRLTKVYSYDAYNTDLMAIDTGHTTYDCYWDPNCLMTVDSDGRNKSPEIILTKGNITRKFIVVEKDGGLSLESK